MAKRFTDTDKWKKRWFSELPKDYKIFWLYLLDDCNHAGIWNVEIEVAKIRLNIKINESNALQNYGNRILPFDNQTKWFISDFIEYQYGTLSIACKPHKPIIELLTKYDLLKKLSKGYPIPFQENAERVKEKEKEQVKEFLKEVSCTVEQPKKEETSKDERKVVQEENLFTKSLKLKELVTGQMVSGSMNDFERECYQDALQINSDINFWRPLIEKWKVDSYKCAFDKFFQKMGWQKYVDEPKEMPKDNEIAQIPYYKPTKHKRVAKTQEIKDIIANSPLYAKNG